MQLDPVLLEILACPQCHAELRADDAESVLACTGCGLRYPVGDDNIPVMLVDEAVQGEPGPATPATPPGTSGTPSGPAPAEGSP